MSLAGSQVQYQGDKVVDFNVVYCLTQGIYILNTNKCTVSEVKVRLKFAGRLTYRQMDRQTENI